jgi:hypothetical protein
MRPDRPPPRAGEEPSSTNGCEWAHRPAKRFVGRPGEMRAQASGPGFWTVRRSGLQKDLSERFPVLDQPMSLGRLLKRQLAIDHRAT